MRVLIYCRIIGLLMLSPLAAANNYHNLQDIQDTVEKFLYEYYEKKNQSSSMNKYQSEISVNRIDPRLKLFQCDKPLTLSINDNGNIGGNVSVKTQCQGSKPWSVYVSTRVAIMDDVIVAITSLPKGTVLSAGHIDVATVNISEIGSHYATDINQLIGKAISRNIQRGKPIRLANLKEPTVVKRGQEVVIEAQTGGIMVAAYATAMSDGRIGEKISVKNNQSNQVVKATVLSSGRVGVRF
ncbi:MAG: flagellar basal body P-ring formation protein FlgA [Cellvibrionaceae bacterium]